MRSYPKTSELILDAEKVVLSGSHPVHLLGNITFHNFECTTPGKKIYFEAGKTYTFQGIWKIQGAYGENIRLLSSEQGVHWYVSPEGIVDISYAWVEDSYNLAPEEIVITESTNRGSRSIPETYAS